MAKFVNRKEQTYDFRLSPYGRYLLSIGRFSPYYYAFFDDNVLYDGKYAGLDKEHQNEIHNRIKNQTPYLGTQTIFTDVEKVGSKHISDRDRDKTYFAGDVIPVMEFPREDNFKIEGMIGDAWLEGVTQEAPAWKIVALGGTIKSSSAMDTVNEVNIPQINMEMRYKKIIESALDLQSSPILNEDPQINLYTSEMFADGNVIKLVADDIMIYAEESNTALLTENFDIEVFEVDLNAVPAYPSSRPATDSLRRLYFERDFEKINGGMLDPENYNRNANINVSTSSLAYYLDMNVDAQINRNLACRGAELFNQESYYVDLDFDCTTKSEEKVYTDIYGPVTEPDICL